MPTVPAFPADRPWLEEPTFPIDPIVHAKLVAFAENLKGEGAAVTPIASPLPARAMLATYMTLLLAALSRVVSPAALRLFDLFRAPAKIAEAGGAGPLSWAHGVLGYTARHHEWLAANEERARMKAEAARVLQSYDVVIAPVTPTAAPSHNNTGMQASRRLTASDGSRFRYLEQVDWCVLAILCDLPATVIPVGQTPEGLPVGVQIIGRPAADGATLAVAETLETVAGGFQAPTLR